MLHIQAKLRIYIQQKILRSLLEVFQLMAAGPMADGSMVDGGIVADAAAEEAMAGPSWVCEQHMWGR
jgi:hypothetical protein